MVDMTAWMNTFLQTLNETFTGRVWFVGLQGSYGRGEATADSDIDVVVVLDNLTAVDVQAYRAMLDRLPHRELICGFLSGRQELLNWDPSDLFQFYHDTCPMFGTLDELVMRIDDAAVERAIRTGICNVYHGCVHNMLHEKSDEILRGLYKSASFVVQAIVFRQTGRYIRHQVELLEVASAGECEILGTFARLKQGASVDFDAASAILLAWAQHWIANAE